MASEVHVLVVGASDGFEEMTVKSLDRYESLWSRYLPDSDVSRMNRAGGRGVTVAPETITLIRASKHAYRASGGRFDPTVLGTLVAAGDINARPGSRGTITRAEGLLSSPPDGGCDRIEVLDDESTVLMPTGVGFDPGGIGKGLAADLVVLELLDSGASGAMVNIGGDMRAEGTPPSGSRWAVAVEDPFNPEAVVATLRFDNGAVATSSTSGRRLPSGDGHLIDPGTRRPLIDPDVSCTVVAGAAWLAEAFAKAALVAGGDMGLKLVDDARMAALMVSADGLRISDRLSIFL